MNIEALSGSWRRAIAIGLCLSAVGCTTSPPVSNSDAGLVTVPVEFKDYVAQPVGKGPQGAQLWLGTIPGQLYGSTQAEFKTIGIGASISVAVPMTELERFSANHARRLTAAAAASGFTITPSDARLARVATGVLSQEALWRSASTGLAESSTKKVLTLVYFDRPCRLSGTVSASGGARTDDYDVVIEKAGLHLLETTKVTDSHWEIRRAPATARAVVTVRAKQKAI